MDIRPVGSATNNDNNIEQEIQKYLDQIEQLANNPDNIDEIKSIEDKIQGLIDQITDPTDKAALKKEFATLKMFTEFFEADYAVDEQPIETKRDLILFDTLIDGEFTQTLTHDTNIKDTITNELNLMKVMFDDLKNCDAVADAQRIKDEMNKIQGSKGLLKTILAQLPQLNDKTLEAQLKDLLTNPTHGIPFYMTDIDYFTIDGLINQMKDYLNPATPPAPTPIPEPMPNPGTSPQDQIRYDLYEIQQYALAGNYAEVEKLMKEINDVLIPQITNPDQKAALISYMKNLDTIVNNFGNPQSTISPGNAYLIDQMIEGQFDSILTNPDPRMPGPILLELAMMQALVLEMQQCGGDKTRLAALQKMFNEYSKEVYAQTKYLEPDIAADIRGKLTDGKNGIPYFMQSGQLDVLSGFVHQIQAEVAVAKIVNQ
jgi:hypothetical protein